MTWLSHPPQSVHIAEDELPNNHGESGLVWEASDGSIWLSQRFAPNSTTRWVRVHPNHEAEVRAYAEELKTRAR
jgi:hypothetical protein